MRILANENFPGNAVEILRSRGHDVIWVRTAAPGSKDREILHWAQAEDRLIITFDKDFGYFAFRSKLPASCGVILFRISSTNPEIMAEKIVAALESRTDSNGCFAVVEENRVRMRPL